MSILTPTKTTSGPPQQKIFSMNEYKISKFLLSSNEDGMKVSKINVDTRPVTQTIPPNQRVFIAYLFCSSPSAFRDNRTSDDDMGLGATMDVVCGLGL
tara:strand:+ start:458 stop:751 length:294 start_codon:yes stop_codon:yes gene_type:complete